MTVRALIVVIDDEKPLGPQLAGARVWGVPWKLLQQLAGGYTTRHLQSLAMTSHLCERQAVQWKVTLDGSEKVPPPEEF